MEMILQPEPEDFETPPADVPIEDEKDFETDKDDDDEAFEDDEDDEEEDEDIIIEETPDV